MTEDKINAELLAADNAWHQTLVDELGPQQAITARYTAEGHGKPGTPLRAAYDLRAAAIAAWEARLMDRVAQ